MLCVTYCLTILDGICSSLLQKQVEIAGDLLPPQSDEAEATARQ